MDPARFIDIARTANTAELLLRYVAAGRSDEQDVASLREILQELEPPKPSTFSKESSFASSRGVRVAKQVIQDTDQPLAKVREELKSVLEGLDESAPTPSSEFNDQVLRVAGMFRQLCVSAQSEAAAEHQFGAGSL